MRGERLGLVIHFDKRLPNISHIVYHRWQCLVQNQVSQGCTGQEQGPSHRLQAEQEASMPGVQEVCQ